MSFLVTYQHYLCSLPAFFPVQHSAFAALSTAQCKTGKFSWPAFLSLFLPLFFPGWKCDLWVWQGCQWHIMSGSTKQIMIPLSHTCGKMAAFTRDRLSMRPSGLGRCIKPERPRACTEKSTWKRNLIVNSIRQTFRIHCFTKCAIGQFWWLFTLQIYCVEEHVPRWAEAGTGNQKQWEN